jgi:DNA replication protein DnaC
MDLKAIVDGLNEKAKVNIPLEAGDYVGENGLMFCGKCKSAKETIVNFLGTETKVRCLCECGKIKRDQDDLERERGKIELEYHRVKVKMSQRDLLNWLKCHNYKISPYLVEEKKQIMIDRCFPTSSAKKRLKTFENDNGVNPKIKNIARRYAENFERMKADGKGLLLFGKCGVGKTYAAIAIANYLLDRDYSCYVTNFSRIANISDSPMQRQEEIDRMNEFDLIVLDDMGIERTSPYMNEIVYNIVDGLCAAKKCIIVTTNMTEAEIKKPNDISKERIYQRLFECTIPINVDGVNNRVETLKQDFETYRQILEF